MNGNGSRVVSMRGRRLDDAGQVAGIEVLPFGFLILVIGALLLANAWAVVDAKMAVTAAAREATRSYVEASDASGAATDADRAAVDAIGGHGFDASELDLDVGARGGWGRCAVVTAEARVEVAAVGLPFIGGFGRSFEVAATYSEVVDPYRSGLPGEAACDG